MLHEMASLSINTRESYLGQKQAKSETNYLPYLTIILCIGGYTPPLLARLFDVQRHKYIFTLDREKNVSHCVHIGIRG